MFRPTSLNIRKNFAHEFFFRTDRKFHKKVKDQNAQKCMVSWNFDSIKICEKLVSFCYYWRRFYERTILALSQSINDKVGALKKKTKEIKRKIFTIGTFLRVNFILELYWNFFFPANIVYLRVTIARCSMGCAARSKLQLYKGLGKLFWGFGRYSCLWFLLII